MSLPFFYLIEQKNLHKKRKKRGCDKSLIELGNIYSTNTKFLDLHKAAHALLKASNLHNSSAKESLQSLFSGTAFISWSTEFHSHYLAKKISFKKVMDRAVLFTLCASKYRSKSSNLTRQILVHGVAMIIIQHLCESYMRDCCK